MVPSRDIQIIMPSINKDVNILINIKFNAIISLRAKRVEEFIEIRHKQISPTRILSTLCDSVANKFLRNPALVAEGVN